MNRSFAQRWIPFAGSFGVYVVPLVGPHAMWLLGELLLSDFTRAGDKNPGWIAADVALAVSAQLAVGLALAWSIRGSRRRLLVWIAALPLLVSALNTAYLVAIPARFLIEPDTRPELMVWKEQCFIPHVSLMAIRTTVNQPVTGVHQWWVQRPDQRYGLMTVPDCAVADATLPVPRVLPGGRADFLLGFQFVAPGGAATLERLVPASSERTFWLLASPASALKPIEQPALAEAPPILSDAGDALAWMQRVAGWGPPVLERIIVRSLQPSSEFDAATVELSPFGAASYTLMGVDTSSREVILWRNEEPFVVGFDGRARETSFKPGPIRPQASTYLRRADGWVAWDAYRDSGPYQLSWSLPAGLGTHRTNNGRSITSATVDPRGLLIAMSETTTLNIGATRDVVYVIRASDGGEVFRAYLPQYARTPVVFFEGGFFAYSDLAGTHILGIPR